jgi:pimeloyl-ACP methyl ester carboxylesterase
VSAARADGDPSVHGATRSSGLHRELGATIREERTNAGGQPVRYLTAGDGPPLVLLHALGDNALDWSWVLPTLSQNHRVYAPVLPGIGGDGGILGGSSPVFFASFAAAFLDTLGVGRAAIVGNSYGGLVALRLALSDPVRVSALGLVDSAGLGRTVSYALRTPTLPGYGELAIAWARTPPGAAQRAWLKANLLFAHPRLVPAEWLSEQHRLARTPGFLEATLGALRAQIGPGGQREVLLEELHTLTMPTLLVWGACDRIFPRRQAEDAIALLEKGRLAVIPDCGHLPQVECPDRFADTLGRFLDEMKPLTGSTESPENTTRKEKR